MIVSIDALKPLIEAMLEVTLTFSSFHKLWLDGNLSTCKARRERSKIHRRHAINSHKSLRALQVTINQCHPKIAPCKTRMYCDAILYRMHPRCCTEYDLNIAGFAHPMLYRMGAVHCENLS